MIMASPRDAISAPPQTKFVITQLKFKSQSYEKQKNPSKITITPSVSLQNWNKNFIIRAQQKRKMRTGMNINEQFGLMQEADGEAKNNMFMAWKERNHSHLRLQSTSNKFYTQVVRSIKKSNSERKFREIPYDLQARRLTAFPAKHRLGVLQSDQIPLELMAHKLEWEDKVVRRINPTAQLKFNRREREGPKDKSILIKISGWDYAQNDYDHGPL